jgi:hypothetical protein
MSNRSGMSRVALVFLAVGLLVGSGVGQAQTVVDSINGSGTPGPPGTWIASTYGIEYTPTSSYQVTRIEANWNGDVGDGRTITVEVYDANPNSGGVKLAEGSFAQTGSGWQGADLDNPVSFQAGEGYFIGFSNTLDEMGRFFTDDDSGTEFTVWWGDAPSDYSNDDPPPGYHTPIWRFIGSSVVAVPALSPYGVALLIVALAGLAIVALRRL